MPNRASTLEQRLIEAALADPVNRTVLDGLHAMKLPDAWLASGCVFQPVWNALTGRPPRHGINDYDVFYFDQDTSYEAEDAVIRRCAERFTGIAADIQVRNQARVHLWYPQKFGQPYPPLRNATEGLTRFLSPCCAVALQRTHDGHRVAAPFGLEDLFAMVVHPNPQTTGPRDQYEAKAARWKSAWPEITVMPWLD